MKIAVIGNGNVGSGLASVLGKTGNEVEAYGRDDDLQAAVNAADLVILATPYGAAADVTAEADFAGKVVVDVSNPVNADFSGLEVGQTTSAAEEIASLVPGARVVKAFNTTFAQHYGAGLKIGGTPLQTFVASDDDDARDTVKALAEAAGFEAVDAGPLKNARYLEPLGFLNIQFGYVLGKGTGIAPRWQLS
jgi:predicted dinucleotide-binding enzyme